ncbi:MAG: AmmeMemoRadiSam system protein B [Kiloniellaceae bacterium]
MKAVRPPAVAGSFYPDDPAMLRAVVDDFLEGARPAPCAQWPKAIIAPHAGYIYSGPVAASAYATLTPAAGHVERVVLVGPSHFVPFRGVAAPRAEAFTTPLGEVPVDSAAVEAIRDLPQVTIADGPHGEEHALEVQLPFLQVVLGAVAVVPLAVGDARPAEVAEVLARLWGGAETLIVVSSDLSHYHPEDVARRMDDATATAIEALEGARLGPEDACGFLAVAGFLAEAKARRLRVERLDLRTSGDVSGFTRRVVGYGAWAFRDNGTGPAATA